MMASNIETPLIAMRLFENRVYSNPGSICSVPGGSTMAFRSTNNCSGAFSDFGRAPSPLGGSGGRGCVPDPVPAGSFFSWLFLTSFFVSLGGTGSLGLGSSRVLGETSIGALGETSAVIPGVSTMKKGTV